MIAYFFSFGFFGKGTAAPQVATDRLAFAATRPRAGIALRSARQGRFLDPLRGAKALSSGPRHGQTINSNRSGKLVEFTQ